MSTAPHPQKRYPAERSRGLRHRRVRRVRRRTGARAFAKRLQRRRSGTRTVEAAKDFGHNEYLNWSNSELTNDWRKQPQTFRRTPQDKAQKQPSIMYGRLVGGGTVHFTANYWRFHEIDFIEASKKGTIAGTGFADWPITYADLEPYYTKAEWDLGVWVGGRSPFDPPRSKPYPLPPMPVKPWRSLRAWRAQAGLPSLSRSGGRHFEAVPGTHGVPALRMVRRLRMRAWREVESAAVDDSAGHGDRAVRDQAAQLRAQG